MDIRALVLPLCLLLPLSAAAEVYRWEDADGVVHYSQTPPAEGDYRAVKPRLPAPTAAPALQQNQRFLDQAAGLPTPPPVAEAGPAEAPPRTLNAERCALGRDTLSQLDAGSPRRYLIKNEDGTVERMSDEQAASIRQRATAMVAESCP